MTIFRLYPALLVLLLSFLVTEEASAQWRLQLLDQNRCLSLHRPQSNETANFCYWIKGKGLSPSGYRKANHILRDVKYRTTINIDPALLDTLFIIQQWLLLEGRSGEIHILSGYRTPEHNASLKNSAKNSLHMKGLAADIHIPGTSTTLLAAMSRLIGTGGVGIYPRNNFIHIDTGRVRMWKN